MSDELYDSLSYATFTLSASEYQCGEAGHTGSITDICLNSVDLSDWDANRKIKVNFDISFQCDTPGCPRGKEMNRYNKTISLPTRIPATRRSPPLPITGRHAAAITMI